MSEPTLGEIARRLDAVRDDIKDDLREVGARLDTKVSMERYQLEERTRDDAARAVVERVRALEDAIAEEARQREADRRAVEERRRADRRWWVATLIAPALLLIMQAYINARGAGA